MRERERERERLNFTFFSKDVTSFESGVRTLSRLTVRGGEGEPNTVVTSAWTTVETQAKLYTRETHIKKKTIVNSTLKHHKGCILKDLPWVDPLR